MPVFEIDADPPQPSDFGWPGRGPFSPAELAEVLRLRREGMGVNELARLTGRARSHISRVCKQAGLVSADIVKPVAPVLSGESKHSELTKARNALVAKAATKADLMLDAIDAPITVRRINTRTGVTEKIRLPRPDPGERRDLAGGAYSLIQAVNAAVNAGDPTGTNRGAIIELVEHLNKAPVVAHDLAEKQIVHSYPPVDEHERLMQLVFLQERLEAEQADPNLGPRGSLGIDTKGQIEALRRLTFDPIA